MSTLEATAPNARPPAPGAPAMSPQASSPAPGAAARALVTGAGRRVGRAIAEALGARGAHVAVHHHGSAEGARACCEAIRASGGQATPFRADLSQLPEARRLVRDAATALGGLDLVVASAASFERVPWDALDDEALARALHLNLASTFALLHEAAPALRASRGSAVVITCSSATVPFKNHLPYVVSKGAALHLVRTLALELAPEVRVNAVAPGTVLPPDELPPEAQERLRRALPLQRFGEAADVARAVVYLAESPFVTGQELAVDGGRALVRTELF